MRNQTKLITLLGSLVLFLTGLTYVNYEDSRNPDAIDLQTIMRLIYMDIQTINEGIYTENYALIKQGADAINNHPPLSAATLELVKSTLGDRMAAFGQYDNLVHSTADSLKNAAANRDMDAVLSNYQIIQQGCVSCHLSFRDEITRARLMAD